MTNKPALFDMVKKMGPQLQLAVPDHIKPERMLRIVLTAISKTPKLGRCTPESFLGAMMASAQLGLEPNTPLGFAYLIPYKNQCQFQIGYKGMLDIAYRSKQFKMIYAEVVKENDIFRVVKGLHKDLIHEPAIKDAGKSIAYYAVYHTTSGGINFEVMTHEEVTNHMKKFSKSWDKGPWKDHFDEMAKKTVLKKLLKLAPQSIEMAQIQAHDQATIKIDPTKIEQTEFPVLESAEIEFNSDGTQDSEERREAKRKLDNILDIEELPAK